MSAERREMSASCFWFPAVGAVLGLILSPAAHIFYQITGTAAVAAWGYVLLSAWLTRALHIDGLADIADALGSGKTGPDFHNVLKDSRIGAFGCLAVVLAVTGQMAAASACIQTGAFTVLFFAPLFGRCLPMLFTALAPVHPQASLGAILTEAPAFSSRLASLLIIAILGPMCLGLWQTVTAVLLTCFALFFLARLARREDGYNGDFFGALIVAGECAVLLSSTPAAV